MEFYSFIDQVSRLFQTQEKRFKSELQQFEEEKRMRYTSGIERLGREEGFEEGRKMAVKGQGRGP